jgi:aryl carrier-like protein
VTLGRVPPRQSLVDDLAGCTRLQRLTVIFAQPDVPGRRRADDIALVDLEPLGKLKRLRQLKIVRVARPTDWSFLADLPELEEVWIGPTGWHGGSLDSWVQFEGPIPTREQSPFHYLCELRSLKKVELFGTPAYAADIERLLANSPIEELRFDLLPDGLDSLKALRSAKSLRRLHVSASYLGDDRAAARAILDQLQIKNLTMGPPCDNVQ